MLMRRSPPKRVAWLVAPSIVVTVAWSGCTHAPTHPTKSEREWTLDHQACERSVREGIRAEPDTYDIYDEMRLIRQCMRDNGWQWKRTGLFNRTPK